MGMGMGMGGDGNGNGKANDLRALVAALWNPSNLLDLSRVSTVKKSPVELHSHDDDDSAGSKSSSSRLPFMTTNMVKQLERLANCCQYDDLEKLLLSATFETPVRRSHRLENNGVSC